MVAESVERAARGSRAEDDRRRRQRLGQFFTPPEVARFAWNVLRLLEPRPPKGPLVVDPAVGEGVFFAVAEETGFRRDARFVGVDLDAGLVQRWRERFGSNARVHMSVADGLLDDDEVGLRQGSADFVVGNPPFGGDGLRDLLDLIGAGANGETAPAGEQLFLFGQNPGGGARPRPKTGPGALAPDARSRLENRARRIAAGHVSWRADFGRAGTQAAMPWRGGAPEPLPDALPRDAIRRLAATPIETLFTERFVRLCRPGGWLAVVLPAGIFAAAHAQSLRDWMLTQGHPAAIATLPLQTFSGFAANVEASLLFFRKFRDGESAEDHRRGRVAMASPPDGVPLGDYLDDVLARIRRDRAVLARAAVRG